MAEFDIPDVPRNPLTEEGKEPEIKSEKGDWSRGERIYKVFVCHGCQSCWEMKPDGSLKEHFHILGKEDITDKVTVTPKE